MTEREALAKAIETIAARFRSGNRIPVDKAVVPASEWSALVAALAQPVAAEGWQPIETAPSDELVAVFWLDPEDGEHPERHDLDHLENGCWSLHENSRENFLMCAPPECRGPKETPPYTHWKRLGAPTPA